jgi:hypothetical protein
VKRGKGKACVGCDPDKAKEKALRQLGRAYRSGALAALGDVDGGQLGALDPNAWIPDPGDVDAEENSFDARLNAWLVDYQAAAPKLSPALVQQIDDFVQRWRDRSTFWIVSANKQRMVIGFEAEFNKFVDQVSAAGHPTAVQPATVTVDGVEHRADQIPPPPPGVFDHIESIVKWGGIALGAAAAYKIASELGLVARLGRMIGGGGGGGGAGGVRRYGSARRQ